MKPFEAVPRSSLMARASSKSSIMVDPQLEDYLRSPEKYRTKYLLDLHEGEDKNKQLQEGK